MKVRIGLAAAGLAVLLCTQVQAVKTLQRITPANGQGEGFKVTVEERENGTLRFTVTRDLSKSRWPGREALLEVRGKDGPIVACRLDGERNRRTNTLEWWFDLGKEQAAASALTVTEVQTAGDEEGGEKLLGGGTYYRFNLREFARL